GSSGSPLSKLRTASCLSGVASRQRQFQSGGLTRQRPCLENLPLEASATRSGNVPHSSLSSPFRRRACFPPQRRRVTCAQCRGVRVLARSLHRAASHRRVHPLRPRARDRWLSSARFALTL